MRLGRIFGRGRAKVPGPAHVEDPSVAAWAAVASATADRLGPAGAFAVALLGESLTRARPSYWFGHEPDLAGLERLLGALGERTDGIDELLAAEASMSCRHLGLVPDSLRDEWSRRLRRAAAGAREAGSLPPRHASHLEAEAGWREAAAAISPGRVEQLDPESALRQLRWFPGCRTRTFVGYSDPLRLASVQRAVQEHAFTDAEWRALARVEETMPVGVDPLAWRLSAMTYAATSLSDRPGPESR